MPKCNKIFRQGFFDLDDNMIEVLKGKLQQGILRKKEAVNRPTWYMDENLDRRDMEETWTSEDTFRDDRHKELIRKELQKEHGHHDPADPRPAPQTPRYIAEERFKKNYFYKNTR